MPAGGESSLAAMCCSRALQRRHTRDYEANEVLEPQDPCEGAAEHGFAVVAIAEMFREAGPEQVDRLDHVSVARGDEAALSVSRGDRRW
jgi:hypothetical protein